MRARCFMMRYAEVRLLFISAADAGRLLPDARAMPLRQRHGAMFYAMLLRYALMIFDLICAAALLSDSALCACCACSSGTRVIAPMLHADDVTLCRRRRYAMMLQRLRYA